MMYHMHGNKLLHSSSFLRYMHTPYHIANPPMNVSCMNNTLIYAGAAVGSQRKNIIKLHCSN